MSARNSEFCDLYPRFLKTTETVASPNRLNRRHQAIIAWNADFLRNQRVLDMASHDGRWSFAALKIGARHVTGIEARPHLVKKAFENFAFYEISQMSYRFISGLVVPTLQSLPDLSFDVVMCLGFLYHTMEHQAVLREARRLATQYLIVDTDVAPDQDALIRLREEPVADPRNSVDCEGTGRAKALVGVPSRSAIAAMLDFAGYDLQWFDWHGIGIVDWTDIGDYRNGARVTLRASRR
jgi:hypothetical protein